MRWLLVAIARNILRGLSINQGFGICDGSGVYFKFIPWSSPDSEGNNFMILTKISQIRRSAQIYVIAGEADKSINDAQFWVDYAPSSLNDIPATYRGDSTGMGLADDHVEMHKWKRLKVPVPGWVQSATGLANWGAANQADAAWLLEHAGQR